MKVWKTVEYWMYFPFFKLHSWGKRSAVRRRRFIQRLLKECSRAEVVTFLWRAAGSPEPVTTGNPFVDVKTTDFFYKAVLWAAENSITNGVDATHFGPSVDCNRAQVVTFLYRAYNN